MASGSGKPLGYQMMAANHPQSPTLLMLKDYLRDDLSSCSSSGFKSLPRRQCCLQPRSSSSSCSTKWTLQRATEALLNAMKSLTFLAPLSKTQMCKSKKGGVISRSISRRLLNSNRSFWRRAPKFPTTTASSANSNSCTESHFTEMEGSLTTTNTSSITRAWPNEEKEQFSPVSVLDYPVFDDDEDITSPINSTSSSRQLGGAKHKHMLKRRHFNRVASLKPVVLERKITWSEMQENEPIYNHPAKPCPVLVSVTRTQNGNSNLFGDNLGEKARDLLNHVKKSIPTACLRIEEENLLFDFFRRSIGDNNDIENSMKSHLCKVAEDWVLGQPQEQYSSLKVYIKEIDKCGSWRNFHEEIQRLAMELEVDFSTSLVNELVLDLTTG
ncbi:uncharacterized protein LOC133284313 [Gastrolobium bilobum]|uniref:uncharacterized protein LOC133284313 n=1 Tax=Gastrolobium bilobum TaxID=150636 RepID=UPI002AB2B1B1|nr:uncharacterized protein LOC133284313 [Gastrolobium bilobum]